jgi:hypothetical protein
MSSLVAVKSTMGPEKHAEPVSLTTTKSVSIESNSVLERVSESFAKFKALFSNVTPPTNSEMIAYVKETINNENQEIIYDYINNPVFEFRDFLYSPQGKMISERVELQHVFRLVRGEKALSLVLAQWSKK